MTSGSIDGLAGVLLWTEAERFQAMARFYRDTLGLTPRSAKSDFINFDWSGVRLSLGVHDRVRGASREPLRITDEKGKPIKYSIVAKQGYMAPREVE